jgi:hypothetical protein
MIDSQIAGSIKRFNRSRNFPMAPSCGITHQSEFDALSSEQIQFQSHCFGEFTTERGKTKRKLEKKCTRLTIE